MPSSVRILDVDVDAVTLAEAVDAIGDAVDACRGHGGSTFQVATVNPQFVILARGDRAFRDILRGAALRVPDGVGVVQASWILGRPLPGRVPGVELVQSLAASSARRGHRLFLLGAAPGVAEAVATRLLRHSPGLTVAGTFAGDASEAGDAESLGRIREARADILLVAYGAPAQERWLARNLVVSGAAAGIGVGGTFDYLAGRVQRAPAVMRRLGLEWLFRVVRQPWRIGRIAQLPLFLLLVIRQRLRGT
ncbi:MAG: WecB/TagA/CpsF family glycosyltransferase [Candidatus Dormibacteria bacterium]